MSTQAQDNIRQLLYDIVEAYNHNLPDVLELILSVTFRELLNQGFDDIVLGKMVRECIEVMLKERGYNEDEVVDILNT